MTKDSEASSTQASMARFPRMSKVRVNSNFSLLKRLTLATKGALNYIGNSLAPMKTHASHNELGWIESWAVLQPDKLKISSAHDNMPSGRRLVWFRTQAFQACDPGFESRRPHFKINR